MNLIDALSDSDSGPPEWLDELSDSDSGSPEWLDELSDSDSGPPKLVDELSDSDDSEDLSPSVQHCDNAFCWPPPNLKRKAAMNLTLPRLKVCRTRCLPCHAKPFASKITGLSDSDSEPASQGQQLQLQVQQLEPICPVLLFDIGREPAGPFGLEFFSGSNHLSSELVSSTCLQNMYVIDACHGPAHDVSDYLVVKAMCEWMRKHRPAYVHFAPPCNTFSIARHPKVRSKLHPEGIPELESSLAHLAPGVALGNIIAKHTIHMMQVCCEESIPCSIENPASSFLFKLPAFKWWADLWLADQTILDYCQYGELYRKRTAIFSWAPGSKAGFMRGVAACCRGDHQHIHLSGWKQEGVPCRTTKGSAAYPKLLCKKWALCVAAILQD